MKETSAGRAYATDFAGFAIASGVTVPLRVNFEDGARIPVFDGGRYTSPVLRLTPVGGVIASTLSSTFLLSDSSPMVVAQGEYKVNVENLPDDCAVKAMKYGSMDLKAGTLKVSGLALTTANIGNVPVTGAALRTIVNAAMAPATSQTELVITLTSAPTSVTAGGIRVTGRMKEIQRRTIYMSGLPGTIYSDGTFEFRNVPPGRHAIVTPDHPANAHPFAASIVVADRDVDGINLDEAAVLPPDIRDVVAPAPAGSHPAGTSLPLATVRGRVISDATREPVSGVATILGLRRSAYPINADGRFEIPRLLPGQYNLEISIPDHAPMNQDLVIDDDDVALELTAHK